MRRASSPLRRRRGFTFLEVVIAVSVFAVVGLTLARALSSSEDSRNLLFEIVEDNQSMRESTAALADDFGLAGEESIAVTELEDGNHEVRFMQPVEVGGNLAMGAWDDSFGDTDDERNKPGWQVVYTVVDFAGDGSDRRLLRRIVDDEDDVQLEETIATGLANGLGANPGFQMVKAGDMWEVSLSKASHAGSDTTTRTVFHVRTRN